MTTKAVDVRAAEARRIALSAQGFGVRSRRAPSRAEIEVLASRLGVVQLDSVNVVCRAHYLPVFARLGAYDRSILDRCAWSEPRTLFEYWAHQASILPVASHRLFRWRMERAARGEGTWRTIARFGKEKRVFVESVLAEIASRGPTAASELSMATKSKSGWWEWSDAKRAVEWLFWSGRLTASTRVHFERLYDLPERVLPHAALASKTPDVETAHRELLAIASRAHGIATEDDLCDYFRLSRRESRPRIAELVDTGELIPARVEGWTAPAYLHAGAAAAKVIQATALLTPFDPIVWYRPRAERVFGFRYRISIYTPEHLRTHGYYVLPFLLGDRLVARVDLKADRSRGALLVRAAYAEDGVVAEKVASSLGGELGRLASWLELDRVEVSRKGDLATALRAALRG